MSDDIVQELRDWAAIVEEAAAQNVHVQVLNMNICNDAADEIEHLRSLVAAWEACAREYERGSMGQGDLLFKEARNGR